jgi:hypothetical protein
MRRQERDEHPGFSPAFGHVGYAPPGSIGTPDLFSPLSPTASGRYYSSHLTSPIGSGPRSPNLFNRHNSIDSYGMQASRQGPRPLQPLQPRETMSRSLSESLQSPLRSNMSWKGDSIDYASYPAPGATSPSNNGRQPSLYQIDQQGGGNAVNQQQYNSNTYPSD